MRILHVLDHSIPLHSGYAFRTLSILKEQRALGWETFHLTTPKQAAGGTHMAPAQRVETVDGFEFHRTPPPSVAAGLPVAGELAQMRATTRRLGEVVEAVCPDIIHAHSPVLTAFPALRVARRHGLPVVYEIRAFWEDAAASHGTGRSGGVRYRATRLLETLAARRADAVTTICEGLKSDLIERGLPREKITVIPNAVNLSEFAPVGSPNPDLAAELGLNGKFVFGFIGSFYSYEGLALLVEAMPAILQRRSNARLLLVGGGPEADRLRALAEEKGVAAEVGFTGRVPHDEVTKYYGLVDVLVYPRLSHRLTELVTPLKPLEAMALGKIFAASDVGGHRELIRDRETGYLFRAGDRDDLARTLLRIAEDREAWPPQIARARAFVERERTWQNSVARYRDVYGRIANAPAC